MAELSGIPGTSQVLRGGASSHASEPYQTMVVARRQGLSELSGTPGTNRAQEILQILRGRVLSFYQTYVKPSQVPWTLARYSCFL